MKRYRIIKALLVPVVLALLVTSCYNKQDDTELAELAVTGTVYDTEVDFLQYNTFAIKDSVGLVHDYLTDEQVADFYEEGGANDKIRAYWKDAFVKMGYQYVEDSTFDFGINPTVVMVQNSATLFYGGYYYGYGYWGWYGWYPPPVYYPPYALEVNYSTGSIRIEMADGNSVRDYWAWLDGKTPEEIEQADPSEIPPVIIRWIAAINGVATQNAGYNGETAENGFQEAIDQSPYLKK